MLIARDPKFLFIHIQKTGGTSLATALRNRIADVSTFRGTHDHAAWARRSLSTDYGSYFKFAFVRNPWERLVSWYAMIAERSQKNGGVGANRFWWYVRARAAGFEDFIRYCTDTIDDVDGRKSAMYNQLDYVADEGGNVIVDFVGRYENLERDAQVILGRLGVSDLALPHENRSSHRDYRSYYSDVTRRIVAERYARDIDHFGYRF